MSNVVQLSRRNLLTLLSKLERRERGEVTAATLVKGDGTVVIAVSDEEYYSKREPGPVHPSDDPENKMSVGRFQKLLRDKFGE